MRAQLMKSSGPVKILFAAAALAPLCGAHTALAQSVTYTDVAPAAGLTVPHNPAPNFLLSPLLLAVFTAGGAVADFNNDGLPDIYLISGGGNRDQLYINNGDGTFTDHAADWGLNSMHMGLGAAAGDYNNDGWIDLFVTSLGPASGQPITSAHKLYRNNGNGTFTNVSVAAHVNRTSTSLPDGLGACWGDYDLDGDLDLAVVSWLGNSGGNRLFRNDGNGTFTDVTISAGVNDLSVRGYGPRLVDMNDDRFPELLIAGDFYTSRYFVNLGNGAFANRTMQSGTGLDANGMGSTVGDFNGDGRLDWYVTSIYTQHPIFGVPGTGNMLYINQGNDIYQERSIAAGVNHGGWGWGTQAIDIDHDTDEDIVATNGWYEGNGIGVTEWLNDPTCAFLNSGNATFAEVGEACGLAQHTAQGRGLASIDFDQDGDMDVLILSLQDAPRLFRSNLVGPGGTPSNAHWLKVSLDTSRSHSRVAPNGYGAKVVATVGPRSQVRAISPGSTYLCQSEAVAHFGLGPATSVTQLEVRWPDGRRTVLSNVAADHAITVRYCPADFDENGAGDSSDFFAFLNAFFAAAPEADFNHADGVTSQDFFDFLTAFFEGC
jgi:hypothetical protein